MAFINLSHPTQQLRAKKATQAGLDTEQTISKGITVEVMCFVAPEKLQKTLKSLELLTLFPRARPIANMNINL